MSRRPKRAKTSDSSSPPSPPVAELPPPFASAPVVVNDAVMEQLQHQSSTIASLNESVAHLRSMVNDLITSHSSLKKEVAVLRAASEQSQPHAPLAPTNEGNMMQQQQQVPHLPTMNAIQTERDSSLQLAATTYRLSPPAAAAAINDTTSRTTDEETDAIIADLKEKKQWPVKRNAFKRFSEDASLIKVRFHRSLKYQHLPVRITGDTKEGRLNCKLCAKKDVSRNTAWMCSSCEMPLCVSCVDNEEKRTQKTHHVLWHTERDLEECREICNEKLKKVREDRKRAKGGGDEEEMRVDLNLTHDE